MKAESNIKPAAFEILPLNSEEVEVLFYENIKTLPPIEDEKTERYSFDYYRLIIRNRENLQVAIETSYEAWLALAKNKEIKDSISIPTQDDRLAALEEAMNFTLGLRG